MLVSVCLHCGAERRAAPPFEVMYCDCRATPAGFARPPCRATRRRALATRRAA